MFAPTSSVKSAPPDSISSLLPHSSQTLPQRLDHETTSSRTMLASSTPKLPTPNADSGVRSAPGPPDLRQSASPAPQHQIHVPPQVGPPSAIDDSAMDVSDTSMNKAVPDFYYECHMRDLVALVSRFLQEIVALNDKIPVSSENLTRFHSRTPPDISIRDYLQRIIRFCSIDRAILMVVIYFIDVLSHSYQQFQVNTLTVHRYIITSVTVACKGLCDSFCTNAHYAKVGGISTVELNMLEVEFLSKVQYKIVPPPGRLDSYFRHIMERNSEGIDFTAKGPLLTGPWAGLIPPGLALPADRAWTPDSGQESLECAPGGDCSLKEKRRNGFRAAMRGMSKFLNNPKKRRDVDDDGRPIVDIPKRSKA